MGSTERELEEQLLEAGNRLLQPPSSIDELLSLLDEVENCLSRVEQSPSKSMQTALSPSMKALVADELLRHPDVDVKVAVASCISEITRITAPDAPYDDDRMKDVFQLIVSSFDNLSDESSRSYSKRTLILETVAKVRSCVVMLDLECDGLIVEMFQHFLKAIRDYHPDNVFSSMETIMTLVLEESEDISLDLISPILACVKRNNEEFPPIAQKLGEKVFVNCAIKLKPYLVQARKSLSLSLDDYSKVIESICDGTMGAVGHNDDNAGGEQMVEESKLGGASSEEAAQADENNLAMVSPDEPIQDQVTKESVTETCSGGDHPVMCSSPKSVVSNGVADIGNEDRLADPESSKKPEHAHQADQSVDTNVTSNAEPDDLDSGKIVKSKSKSGQTSNKGGRKPNPLIKTTEPSDSSQADSDKEAERTADRQKSPNELSTELAVPSENEKETIQFSSPKVLASELTNVTSPSPSENILDQACPKKGGRPKKKDKLIQEVATSADAVSKKASEGASDSEAKPERRPGKKAPAVGFCEEKPPILVDTSEKEVVTTSDLEAKTLKQSGRKVDARDTIMDVSSSKKDDGKRRGRGKATSEKDVKKSSAKDNDNETVSSPKPSSKFAKDVGHLEVTPKTNSKRKRMLGKEKACDSMEYGENLVGHKVKVWWPKDQMFYEGTIHSFDSIKKKHKVLYTDGDEELLNLRKQKWEFVVGDSLLDGEQATECESPDPLTEMHKSKKAKPNSEPSPKQGKLEGSRGGEASSSKLKGAGTKSGRKSKDDGKGDDKLKDNPSKSDGKSDDDSGVKSKDHLKKSSGKSGDASRTVRKTKDDDGGTLKTSTKLKQDAPKTASKDTQKTTSKNTPKTTKSKGKASKSGTKSNANGSGKVKSGSVKVKETEGKEKSSETLKAPESAKGKSPDTSKGQEAATKSGKKRRRRAKS